MVEANVKGLEAFAMKMDNDWYAPNIANGDHVFFADDILPDVGDFVALRHLGDDRQRRRLITGYFFPKGGRPDPSSPQTFWDQFKGIELRADPDRQQPHDYDLDPHTYEYIGVAVEIQRPLKLKRAQAAEVYKATKAKMAKSDDEYWAHVWASMEPDLKRQFNDHVKEIGGLVGGDSKISDSTVLLKIFDTWLDDMADSHFSDRWRDNDDHEDEEWRAAEMPTQRGRDRS